MIKIKFWTDGEGAACASSQGHADYNTGNDVVCAAVSALMFTLAGAVENLMNGDKTIRTAKGHTFIRCGQADEKTTTIFQTVLIGLMQIERQYSGYVKIN